MHNYYPIRAALARLFSRPGFLLMCEQWRKRKTTGEYMGDIYDGQVWNDFQSPDGINFLSVPYSFTTTSNLDWFQPFTHVKYSVGVLYMVILNLPREERYKLENIILVAVIPGPKEPKKTANSYLSPLIQELIDLWDGIPIHISSSSTVPDRLVVARLAVVCTACDIPAIRKMCGFAGHSGTMGCSKCKRCFVHREWGIDYSGFEMTEWGNKNPFRAQTVC